MRRTAWMLALALLALGSTGVAVAGKHRPPATGDYEADITDINGTYSQGGWTVVKDDGKRQIVASAQYNGIYYPDPGECDNYSLPLTAMSVPIAKNGKFHVKETDTPAGTTTEIKVDWKGKWKSATKVVGTIKLSSGNCHSSNEYSAEKVTGT